MPSPEPSRNLEVFVFGAGLSSAFGLPNTAALLKELEPTVRPELRQAMLRAYRFLYPDAQYDHYMPDVVDFFSSLSAFVGLGQDWAGTGLKGGRELLRSLKREIAKLLIQKARQIDDERLREHSYLTEAVKPGSVVITTNWDPLVERFAELRQVPLRRAQTGRQFSTSEVTLLKLHGSVDWTATSDAKRTLEADEYASLAELSNSNRSRRIALPTGTEEVPDPLVRIRGEWGQLWSRVSSRTQQPWLVTMVTGKQDELGPLQSVWRDAYSALGRARHLEVAGYSLPPDDIEVRTLLRAGVMRGNRVPTIRVVDPSPATHQRFRGLVNHTIVSDYGGVPRG